MTPRVRKFWTESVIPDEFQPEYVGECNILQQKVFDELKRRFVEGPILVATDYTCPLHMESDASDFATGAVLSMLCEDKKWYPCAFLSKSLNDIKRNYDMHDKEILGII